MRVDVEDPRAECYRCMRATNACICKHVNPIRTKTRFVILMHPKEFRKEKNGTGRMTNLQLEHSEIIVGIDFTNNKRVNEILAQTKESSFILYPGKNNFNLSVSEGSGMKTFLGNSPTIFILDGTWPCAKKMLKLSKNLQQLPRISFNNETNSKFIFKRQPEPLCLSTIESVYTVINLLKKGGLEECDTNGFLLPFEKMVEYQSKNIINLSDKNDPSYTASSLKTNTKRTERNIIFEQY